MSSCSGDVAGSGHCDAIHWIIVGDDVDIREVWSTRSCVCEPEHQLETVYWGICYAPLTDAITDPYSRRKRAGRPWMWQAIYRNQPSELVWHSTREAAETQGSALEAEGRDHGQTVVRCDRTAVDYHQHWTEQDRRRAQSLADYEAWKRDNQTPVGRAGR